jgi:hypothetical protein
MLRKGIQTTQMNDLNHEQSIISNGTRPYPIFQLALLLILSADTSTGLFYSKPFVRSLLSHSAITPQPLKMSPSPLTFSAGESGPQKKQSSLITNVQILKFDADRQDDIIVCNTLQGQILRYKKTKQRSWDGVVNENKLIFPHMRPLSILMAMVTKTSSF